MKHVTAELCYMAQKVQQAGLCMKRRRKTVQPGLKYALSTSKTHPDILFLWRQQAAGGEPAAPAWRSSRGGGTRARGEDSGAREASRPDARKR
ncbi:unnamed protein product [Coccothraustes coccothraustes]